MAKITCYVTAHYTVELDSKEVKDLYGSLSKVNIKDAAFEAVPLNDPYDTTVIIESIEEEEPVKKVKRGVGSY